MADKRDLETRMRRLEIFHALRVPDDAWIIVRVDGRSFSRLTETDFEKPFDARFHHMMVETTKALMTEFNGLYAYTESDEISLLLPRESGIFDREVEKIVSVTASTASATFSLQLGKPAVFDSRIWCGATDESVVDYFAWRQADATRCALNGWCYWTLRNGGMNRRQATAAMEKKTTAEKNELLHRAGINFNNVPAWQRRGTGILFEQYEKDGLDPRSGKTVKAVRRRLAANEELPMKKEYAAFVEGLLATPNAAT